MRIMFGLKPHYIETIHKCFEKYSGIDLVVIYGSRAKENYREGSDIDLMIVGELNYGQFIQLENELDDLLLPQKIDLSIESQISNLELLEHIERVGKVFYDKTRKMILKEPVEEYKTKLQGRKNN